MADGFISDEDIQKVREASDIVAVFGERVPVKQRGRDFWCCCPIHHEKTPSCKLDPSLQLWHCFGCGEGGDIFAFLMKADDLSFREAVMVLADRANIPISLGKGHERGADLSYKSRLKSVCKEAAVFFHTQLMRSTSDKAKAARAYLSGRNLGGEIPKTWNLGFAPGAGQLVRHLLQAGFTPKEMLDANVAVSGRDGKVHDRFFDRVMFPICDVQGDPIAFGGRVMGSGEPKYLNSKETPIFHKSTVLFGMHHAKAAMATTGVAIVVEGYTDVIALHNAGIKNVVATLGTALTMQHIRLLSSHANKRIVYLFDGDEAGQRAADRALSFIDSNMTPEAGKRRIDLYAVVLPDNLDPADFVAKRGVEELQRCLDEALPLLSFGIQRRIAAYDIRSAEGRVRAASDALSVLAPIKDSLLAKDYAVQIAGLTHMREEDLLTQLAQLKAPHVYETAHEADTRASSRFDNDFYAQADASKQLVSGTSSGHSQSTNANLSTTERNRRRCERQLLCVVAQNPHVVSDMCAVLAQTKWHDALSEKIADEMLTFYSEHAQASAAQVVSCVCEVIPQASKILTVPIAQDGEAATQLAQFLAEELAIGDLKDTIDDLRSLLAKRSALSQEEYDNTFQMIVALQKDLTERRKAHQACQVNS